MTVSRFLGTIASYIPFALVRRIGSCKLVIVYYHLVSDGVAKHVKHLYRYKTIRQFVEDVNFLGRYYEPIGLSEIMHWEKTNSNRTSDCVLLTFDDGLREIYDIIAPILLEKGMPAIFFLSSAFIDNRELCYQHKASLLVEKMRLGVSTATEKKIMEILVQSGVVCSQVSEGVLKLEYRRREVLDNIAELLLVDFDEYLREACPYVTSCQVKELIGSGFCIGAHSIDHPRYSDLTLSEQLKQTIGSVNAIRQSFGLDYGVFAFPHNDTGVSEEFFQKLHESGMIDITFGTGGMIDGRFPTHKQRVSLEKTLLPAKEILKWEYARKVYAQWRRC